MEFTNQFVEKIEHRFKTSAVVSAHNTDGKIKIIKYEDNGFFLPVVNDILSTGLSGTTGILTYTNDEALQITGLLLKHRMPAKLIQSNNWFNLFDLDEIRTFIRDLNLKDGQPKISDEDWKNAKRQFINKYKQSSNYKLVKNILVDFQETNPKNKYISDFETFIKESKLEDFNDQQGETLIVSTIHKAKGKEFDNVILMLDDFNTNSDDAKRQLYVAMTRAKENLTIHYNGNFLDNIITDNIQRITISEPSTDPDFLVYNLTHKDINLGYFSVIQKRVTTLKSGDKLEINEDGLMNSDKKQIVKFSKSFQNIRVSLERRGYQLTESKIRFILFWQYKNEEKGETREIKIVLPELYFKTQNK